MLAVVLTAASGVLLGSILVPQVHTVQSWRPRPLLQFSVVVSLATVAAYAILVAICEVGKPLSVRAVGIACGIGARLSEGLSTTTR